MDMSNSCPPPINNLCVPDIYNKLDADVIERTRVANNQLNMRLLVEQKIIAKYRLEAERFRKREKSLMVKDLLRITQKLPAVTRIEDFDEKFFKKRSYSDPLPRRKKKKRRYLEAKNDNPICQRCYIHHLPSKKRFYRRETPPLPSSIFESKPTSDGHVAIPVSNSTYALTQQPDDNDIPSAEFDDPDVLRAQSPTKSYTARFIPGADKFKFLERDGWGRERDLNESLTPRLMPNEIWKNVVKNLCNQCLREQEEITLQNLKTRRFSHSFSREKTFERKGGNKSRRSSIAMAIRPLGNTQPLSHTVVMDHSHQRNTQGRKTSFAVEDDSPDHPDPPSKSSSRLSKRNIRTNSSERPSPTKEDDLSKSQSSIKEAKSGSLKLAGKEKSSNAAYREVSSQSILKDESPKSADNKESSVSAGKNGNLDSFVEDSSSKTANDDASPKLFVKDSSPKSAGKDTAQKSYDDDDESPRKDGPLKSDDNHDFPQSADTDGSTRTTGKEESQKSAGRSKRGHKPCRKDTRSISPEKQPTHSHARTCSRETSRASIHLPRLKK